jgi:hypothetical protein
MPERKDEAHCCKSLSRWLSEKYPGIVPEWQYEPHGRRIPDYRLRLGDREYAVEVTRIASGSEITAFFSFRNLGQEIESVARDAGILKGYYILSFYPPVEEFGERKRDIQRKALEYVSAHRDDETAALEVILPDGRNRLRRQVAIQKMGLDGDALQCLPGGRAYRNPEAHAMVTDALRDAIGRKHRLFEQVKETLPRILLLVHGLPLPDSVPYRLCLQPLASEGLLDGFAAVYLALTDETGDMIHESADCFPPRQQP